MKDPITLPRSSGQPTPSVPLTAEDVKLLVRGDWIVPRDGWWPYQDRSPVRFAKPEDDLVVLVERPDESFSADRFTYLARPADPNDPEGWVAHDGGENPAPGLLINVRSDRDGSTESGFPSECYLWADRVAPITHWRPHTPAPAGTDPITLPREVDWSVEQIISQLEQEATRQGIPVWTARTLSVAAKALRQSLASAPHGGVEVFYIQMPVDRFGNGPASVEDTDHVEHQVWDAETNATICTARDEDTGRRIAAALSQEAEPPHCQKCGGEVHGWICQSCGQDFAENDAGKLVFMAEQEAEAVAWRWRRKRPEWTFSDAPDIGWPDAEIQRLIVHPDDRGGEVKG